MTVTIAQYTANLATRGITQQRINEFVNEYNHGIVEDPVMYMPYWDDLAKWDEMYNFLADIFEWEHVV